MRKLKANTIGLVFGVVLLTWLLVSTAEVFVANTSEKPYEYCKANLWVLATKEIRTCEVVDCMAIDDYYEVVIEDRQGNQWAYYDTEYCPKGTSLYVTFDGTEIINAKIKKERR